MVSVYFSNTLPREEYVKVAGSITFLRPEGNIDSPAKYSYFSILSDYNADTIAASLLIS